MLSDLVGQYAEKVGRVHILRWPTRRHSSRPVVTTIIVILIISVEGECHDPQDDDDDDHICDQARIGGA